MKLIGISVSAKRDGSDRMFALFPPCDVGNCMPITFPDRVRKRVYNSTFTEFAYRICGPDAVWDYNNITHMQDKGYTYYDNCFLPRLRDVINMCRDMDFNTCMQVRL